MATKQPADRSHFILPDLGEGVHEAEIIKWRVRPGESVAELQTLAEMETDKALVEVPSPWPGTVKELNGAEGDIINVGSILVTYDISGGAGGTAPIAEKPAATAAAVAVESDGDAGTVVGSVDTALRVPAALTQGRAASTESAARGRTLATPAVRRVAREREVDINQVPGTGRGGRVTAHDVAAFAGDVATPPAPVSTPVGAPAATVPAVPTMAATLGAPPADGIAQRISIRGVRRTIAEALHRSVQTAVHFTVVDEADATALEAKRREYATVLGRKLSMLPFVMTAVCRALREHPTVNATVDDQKQEILVRRTINLGCAVDTPHGLMVPVVENADTLSVVQLGETVDDLAAQCRNRTIDRERLIGGTFTISNVGSYGGRFATPIINYPEVGILAVGRSYEKVMAADGKFYVGTCLPLSMSCDHRVVDGAEGARFLNTVVRLLEDPGSLVG